MKPELLARYGAGNVPRYTSYPTAPNFSAAIGEREYRAWLGSAPPDAGASIYVHVPFCRSMCWYCGCHTTVASRADPVERYVAALEREAELVAGAAKARFRVRHVHLGGGTPTLMAPDRMIRLMSVLRSLFRFDRSAEVAIEIDPRTLDGAMAAALGAAGFTRASLGVQSFDPDVQQKINRIQSFDQTEAAASMLRRNGIGGLNLDLIYGLPLQTIESCAATVEQALRLAPDRFAVFGYAHVPSFKRHQRRIDAASLPGPAKRLAQFEAIAALLGAAGYVQIGLDHFARPQDSLARAAAAGRMRRNFQGYTNDDSPLLIGLGASAIGRLAQGYVQNVVVIGRYEQRVAAGKLPVERGCSLSPEDRLRGRIIERIMCDYEVDVGALCAGFGRNPDGLIKDARLDRLQLDGLIERSGTWVRVLPEARPLVRSVAAAFDSYLPGAEEFHARAL